MIPKIIHYCWFGRNPYPEKVQYCIESWRKYLPDYEFKLWNEDSFDINTSAFVREAYENQRYAFVSDYVRVFALYTQGGIYLDTDIEVKKDFKDLLDNKLLLGTDDSGALTAFMAAEKNHPYFGELLSKYNEMHFVLDNGKQNTSVNNIWMQECLKKYGYVEENLFQKLEEGVLVYPDEFFHAKSLVSGKYHITKKTYCIHHHTLLWIPLKTRIIRFLRLYVVVPILGEKLYIKLVGRIRK